YLRDISAGTTVRVSVDFNGNEANDWSCPNSAPSISPDGNWVAFPSIANQIVAVFSTAGRRHVYLRNMLAGTTSFVSFDTGTFPPFTEGDSDSDTPALAYNAVSLAFASSATNLIGAGNDTNGKRDIYAFNQGCLTITAQ